MTTTSQPESAQPTKTVVTVAGLEDEPSSTGTDQPDLFRYDPEYGHADQPETD
ncbi:hypothetical protein GCM10023321_85380 [Pseudonocardia eucalypti]|uniref:Uncharacterized protein n=1 Tax=Pseudonocardia eucalypti TaxID=648755 RepID=A0ABP9RFV9_9PSEU|nr:hypothetical protein [Pseudonocardia eucalypti]